MEKMDVSGYAAMLGLVAEMVLDEAIRKRKEETLYREIDSALARGDETSFIRLTQQLKELHS
jgi:uncharacterized protein YpiB (UPF0302 family)